ncbi:biopolymer transporter ExbB [Pontitalea aquivivens]|uniref:biopolymer transporter ExbB n=1 Tax=Pontitalea aquivivens TaxID=3388663 RepID=UPI0039707230
MRTPARQAAPQFSQPVRQVLMMLIVLGLVGLGGWVAYARIYPIFLSNPWLNGAILAVFVVGVLACFWQVVQLIKSVSWIESFAADRNGPRAARAPSLLAPLAALLGSRSAQREIATSSARSILESVATRIDEARDITRYVANLLIFLGLLGTFYGLATTVPAVVETIRALAPQEGESGIEVFDKLMTGLEAQLGGMGTAFSSSLLGLAGSLVVGLLELFVTHGQNRFFRELEEWISSITRLSFAGADAEGEANMAVAVLDHMAEQMEELRALFAGSDVAARALDQRIGHLVAGVEQLTDQLGTEADAGALLTRIAEGQDRMIAGMAALAERIENSLGSGADAEAEARMRLRSIDAQLLRLLEELSAGRQETMADLRHDFASLTRAILSQRAFRPAQEG